MTLPIHLTIKLIFATGLAIALAGCVTSPNEVKPSMNTLAGTWFGEQLTDDGSIRWVNERTEDGLFTTSFKRCQGTEETFYQVKSGYWGVEDNIYQTITNQLSDHKSKWTPATPNRRFTETYQIISLTHLELTYKSRDHYFTVRKIADDYELSCTATPASSPQVTPEMPGNATDTIQ